MERQTIGVILLIIGILIAVFGSSYGANLMYNCPSNGCDPHMFDQINTVRYTMLAIGISISVIGIVLIVRSGVSS
jgi:hypothetical protein